MTPIIAACVTIATAGLLVWTIYGVLRAMWAHHAE
jgi:hypothetical protein